MNEFDSFQSPEEESLLLDRLVDGELDGDEYRQAITMLDNQPGGWRKCALAFLEAQALEVELGAVRRENTISVPQHQPTPRRRQVPWLATLLAVAASFALAFALGTMWQTWWTSANGENPIVVHEPPGTSDRPSLVESPKVVHQPNRPKAGPDGEDEGDLPYGNITLVVGGNGADGQEIEVPIYTLDQLDSRALLADDFDVPRDVQQALLRMGREVRHHDWQLVPIELEDGSGVLIPMKQVEIVPVGGHVIH